MLSQVADGVHVHRSELLRNNATVIEGEAGVLLVDPGLTVDELTCLATDLRALGRPVVAGFATHPDWDHVLWRRDLGDVPRYATPRCAASMRSLRSSPDWEPRVVEGLPLEIADEVPLELFGLLTALEEGATELPWDGPRIRVVEHPAHAPGHAALLVEDAGVLVAGDMLSDVFVPMLGHDDRGSDPLADYLVGLDALEGLVERVEVLIPGHGSVCGAEGVRARLARDRAYVLALRDGREPHDPRLGPTVEPGWEWVGDIHEAQVRRLARRSAGRPA